MQIFWLDALPVANQQESVAGPHFFSDHLRLQDRGRDIDARKKTWWDCVKNDMESLGLCHKNAQFRNKWRSRIKGQPANPGSPGNGC